MKGKIVPILPMILLITASLEAAIFAVNNFTDSVDASVGNGICATAAGQCTLRAAIQEANFANDTDTINLPSGLFTLTIAGANEDLAAMGDLDILHSVIINGAAGAQTHIDGNGTIMQDRVFEIHGGAVELNSLRITDGRVDDAGGCIRNSADLEFDTGEISDCQAIGSAGFGGAIYSDSSSTLHLEFVEIANNHAENAGGALSISGLSELYKVQLAENTAGSAGGIRNTGSLGMDRSTLSGNTPTALVNLGDASVEFTTFYRNISSNSAAAISNFGTLNMRNTTVSQNSSNLAEGGIFAISGSDVTLNNVTITSNTGSNTGGIYSEGDVNLQNTILAGNHRTDGSPSDCSGTINSDGHNLVGNLADCTISGNETGNIYGADPLLGPLEDVGSPSMVHLLQPGSPAVDAGDDAACESLDQREIARPQFASCDIGSVEAQTEFTLRLQSDTINTSTGQNVATTIEVTSYFDFNSEVTLNCIILPPGMNCSFSQNPVIPPANGVISSTLTIDPGNNPEGIYTVNIVGVGGLSFKSKTLTLIISNSLFSDDFEDNDVSDWSFTKGLWSASGGELSGTVERKGDALTPDFGACTNCEISANIRIISPNARVSLLGWYQDKRNLVEIRLMEDKNKVLLKQRSGGGTVIKQKALVIINPGVEYTLRVVFQQMHFTVFLNGAELFTIPSNVTPFGNAGFRVKSAAGVPVTASFEAIRVE